MMFLIEVAAILGFARLIRFPARMIGLPIVVGEMLVGFLLGPSVLGALSPLIFRTMFPPESVSQISQAGSLIVTIYCFVIGLEFDPSHLRGRTPALAITALMSVLIPAAAGFFLAFSLSNDLGEMRATFPLVVALCFAVTAFPVLVRIVEETGISALPEGPFSIGVSAVLELMIWAGLPIILTISKGGDSMRTGQSLLWITSFLLIWATVLRKGLKALWTKIPVDGIASIILLAVVGIASISVSDRLGIHYNFGAFVGGLIVPRSVSHTFAKKLKPVCIFLLPIFFASAGLRTTLRFGSGNEILLLIGIILIVYFVKLLGTSITAKISGGLDWNQSLTVGHLMCAKGAIGFAVLDIFLNAGLLSSKGYSILAFVVLANTIMAAFGVRGQKRIAEHFNSDERYPVVT